MLPFSRKSGHKKKKGVVLLTHEQNVICRKTKLHDIAHEQTIICRQLFAAQVLRFRSLKRKKITSNDNNLSAFSQPPSQRYQYN